MMGEWNGLIMAVMRDMTVATGFGDWEILDGVERCLTAQILGGKWRLQLCLIRIMGLEFRLCAYGSWMRDGLGRLGRLVLGCGIPFLLSTFCVAVFEFAL